MTYLDTLVNIGGLEHHYDLTSNDIRDRIGNVNGLVKGTGTTFSEAGATFDGNGYIELPDHNDFSVSDNNAMSIVVFLTIDDWHGKGDPEYIHWMGKGTDNQHEWVFRHYVKDGTGEAPDRQGRCSFYHFKPVGGQGAGSYYQDTTMPTTERVFVATCNMSEINLYVNGTWRDKDPLSGYGVTPINGTAPVRIGTRDMQSFLKGKVRRVSFFNKVLSASEVTTIWNARTQLDAAPLPPVEPPTQPVPIEDYLAESNLEDRFNHLVRVLRDNGTI